MDFGNFERSPLYVEELKIFLDKVLTWPQVIKIFFHAQLSMNFQLFIKTKMLKIKEISCFKVPDVLFILVINVKMPITWHFNINEQDKLHAQLLSMKNVYNLVTCC